MSACERCWRDSRWASNWDDDAYRKLVSQRNGVIDDACTPEEQAGPDATECPSCKRKTVHQHAHLCQTPGCTLGEYKEDRNNG